MNSSPDNPLRRPVFWEGVGALLDDESPFVRKRLLELFRMEPEKGRAFLLEVSQGSDRLMSKHARCFIEELGWRDGVGDFIRFIRSQRFELETGWFLLDRTVFPEFETSTYTFLLDKFADRCRELILKPSSPRSTCELINRVLFHEYGFRGAREDFENPENGFLHRTLERKEGLPITLCVIYILVARRIGFELDPIGTPGRFMVGCFMEKTPFYVDCWSGGRFVELKQMQDRMGVLPEKEAGIALLPVTVAETLARACRNLSNQYAKANDAVKSRTFDSFVHEIDRLHRKASNA